MWGSTEQLLSALSPKLLGTLADIVQPRTFEELQRYGFDALPEAPAASDDNTPGRLDRWPAEP